MEDTYHHGDLKEELLKKGIGMINEAGIEKLSMRKLADACGVSHQAPYAHFKDKEAYVKAVKKYAMDGFLAELEAAAQGHAEEDVVRALGIRYVTYFVDHPDYFKFFMDIQEWGIEISDRDIRTRESGAFYIFKSSAESVLRKMGKQEEFEDILSMWAMVMGITSIMVMRGVTFTGDLEKLADRLLRNRLKLD